MSAETGNFVAWSEEAICAELLKVGALDIRDVDGDVGLPHPEGAFLYSSGNWGPGYVDVKGTVGAQESNKALCAQVALKLVTEGVEFDNIAGNATGGMIPAYETREAYQRITGRSDVGYVYIRGSRKEGGHKELVTGLQHLPAQRKDGSPAQWLVMEELVNFSETTANSLKLLEGLGFVANKAATILFYDHAQARQRLSDGGFTLTHLTTLPKLIEYAEVSGHYPAELIARYREFLASPPEWMANRGLVKVER